MICRRKNKRKRGIKSVKSISADFYPSFSSILLSACLEPLENKHMKSSKMIPTFLGNNDFSSVRFFRVNVIDRLI